MCKRGVGPAVDKVNCRSMKASDSCEDQVSSYSHGLKPIVWLSYFKFRFH